MTSNLGSAYIQSQFEKINDENREVVIEETKKEVMSCLLYTSFLTGSQRSLKIHTEPQSHYRILQQIFRNLFIELRIGLSAN